MNWATGDLAGEVTDTGEGSRQLQELIPDPLPHPGAGGTAAAVTLVVEGPALVSSAFVFRNENC